MSRNDTAVFAFPNRTIPRPCCRFGAGGRTYDVIKVHQQNEGDVNGWNIHARGRAAGASMGQEDGQLILGCADEVKLNGLPAGAVLGFPEWHLLRGNSNAAYLERGKEGVLFAYPISLLDDWSEMVYLVRRVIA